ncbi:C39 family peptidase [Levilactobacillus zymae]|uniref:C39 family peptidase n=1 Tax=Levilactobacillus zymae TaxID=267363 RepID=UPI0028BD1373|nr:C39 family peptidase [Levilactobacillus zymae]MDT6979661.1 C39 family peptidase [Levilactobacillus zymae]
MSLNKRFLLLLSLPLALLGVSSAAQASSFPAQTKANQVKHPFKVAVVKKGYHLYHGQWLKGSTSTKHFHQSFIVTQKKQLNHRWYYALMSTKKHIKMGYINRNAVATPNQTKLLKVPYISQYKPVFAPWGCAATSMAMLLRSRGVKVNLKDAQNHLPMVPTVGGQKGNLYTGAGFGHVIHPGALTTYAHRWSKKVHNISGSTANQMKLYVQGGQPVLFYGYSSYQKAGDHHRNHCKVITGYKNGKFRVNDPLYYSKNAGAGAGGKNMAYDHGAISWESLANLKKEYNKDALTIE